MEKILIDTQSGHSEIHVGAEWVSFKKLLPEKGVVIITDDNVNDFYGDKFSEFPVISLAPGEDSKQLSVIESISSKLLDFGIDRSGFIVGIGGGVVCDIAGFVASVYMRGIRCAYVSTSLLSQVDASTGGKTGVNLGGTKNIIGTIRQPEFVICDTSLLSTLSESEYLSGLAEVIKTAIIGDSFLFKLIEEKHTEIIERNQLLLSELVARCVRFKSSVVTEDENETGLRRILNFGHTFGHAIEMQESMKHGYAVAAGMELAVYYSSEKGFLGSGDMQRILNLLNKFGLVSPYSITDVKLRQLILHDKKKAGDSINFIFTEGIGKASVKKIPAVELVEFFKRFSDKK